jgi:hypothetical protein
MVLAQIGTGFAVPFIVALTRQLRGGNPGRSILAEIQMVSGILLLVGVLVPVVIIAATATRPGRSPEFVQGLNDVAFTMLMWCFVPATVEAIAVGCAVLTDESASSVFPRWTGYFDLTVAAVYALGAPTLWVKQGAFGWDGVLTFGWCSSPLPSGFWCRPQ